MHLQSVLQAISSRRSSNAIEEGCWCLQYTQPLTSHSPPFSSMLTTTTTKSWRSDTLIILPGWECHTGGSRSKPTVHRCSQSGRRLWVARQVHNHEPNGSATMQQETVHQCQHVFIFQLHFFFFQFLFFVICFVLFFCFSMFFSHLDPFFSLFSFSLRLFFCNLFFFSFSFSVFLSNFDPFFSFFLFFTFFFFFFFFLFSVVRAHAKTRKNRRTFLLQQRLFYVCAITVGITPSCCLNTVSFRFRFLNASHYTIFLLSQSSPTISAFVAPL